MVYGVVYPACPENTFCELDSQSDFASTADVQKAAHDFLDRLGKGQARVSLEHRGPAKASVVESGLAPTDFTLDGQPVTKGSWVAGVRLNDPALKKQVSAGLLNAFSLGGTGLRVPNSSRVVAKSASGVPTQLKDLQIDEIALVKNGANRRRFVVIKSVTGKQNVPVVDTGTWDAGAAQKRLVANATDANGDINYAKLSQGYLWSAPGADSLDDLKFPIMDVSSSGHLVVNRDALSAAARYINRATGIPADELDQMKATLRRYYTQIGVAAEDHPDSIQKENLEFLKQTMEKTNMNETINKRDEAALILDAMAVDLAKDSGLTYEMSWTEAAHARPDLSELLLPHDEPEPQDTIYKSDELPGDVAAAIPVLETFVDNQTDPEVLRVRKWRADAQDRVQKSNGALTIEQAMTDILHEDTEGVAEHTRKTSQLRF